MQKIAEIRKERGLTQKQLSAKLNIYQSNLSNWENGITEPDILNIVKIAEILEVTTDELLGRSDYTGIINTNANLTPDEQHIIDCFRTLSEDGQKSFVQMAESIARAHNAAVPVKKFN